MPRAKTVFYFTYFHLLHFRDFISIGLSQLIRVVVSLEMVYSDSELEVKPGILADESSN